MKDDLLVAQLEQQRDEHLRQAQFYVRQALAIHKRNLPRLQEQLAQLASGAKANRERLALVCAIAEMEMDIADERDLLGELGDSGALQVVGCANAALATLEEYRGTLTTRGLEEEPEREREVEQLRTDVWRRITRVQEVLKDAQRHL
jgi:hypothetical protein